MPDDPITRPATCPDCGEFLHVCAAAAPEPITRPVGEEGREKGVDEADAERKPDPDQLHRYGGDEDWPATAQTFARRIRQENADLLRQLTDERERSMRFAPDFSTITGTSVFVQWKGTDVCLDFYCECGKQGHFDGMFAYSLRCGCGKVWDLPHSFALVPEQRDYPCIQDVEMDADEADPDA